MKTKHLHDSAHMVHAAMVDRDDPFLPRRLRSQAGYGVARTADFSATRRIPAPIEERFTLITTRKATH